MVERWMAMALNIKNEETDRMVRSGRWIAGGSYLGSTLFLSGFALVCGLAIARK